MAKAWSPAAVAQTDRKDAFILAQLLARDEIPEDYRPTPQEREYQHLMKHHHCLVRDRSRVRTKIRSILAARNLDAPCLFSREGVDWIHALSLPPAESFRLRELWGQLGEIDKRIVTAEEDLERFREAAPESQKRKHEIVRSVPGVAPQSLRRTRGPPRTSGPSERSIRWARVQCRTPDLLRGRDSVTKVNG